MPTTQSRRLDLPEPQPPASFAARWSRRATDALAVRGAVKRNSIIRDAAGTENVNGEVVRRERQKATGDKAVDEAYKGLGDTFTFFNDVFALNE